MHNKGSEMDEEEMMISESENSNESWTTEEISSEFIMRYGSRWSQLTDYFKSTYFFLLEFQWRAIHSL